MCVLENNQQGNQIVCFAYTMSKRDSYGKWIFAILLSLAQAEHENGIQAQPTNTHPSPPVTFFKVPVSIGLQIRNFSQMTG